MVWRPVQGTSTLACTLPPPGDKTMIGMCILAAGMKNLAVFCFLEEFGKHDTSIFGSINANQVI